MRRRRALLTRGSRQARGPQVAAILLPIGGDCAAAVSGPRLEKNSMANLDSLQPLMIDELRDLLDAEKQITKALPKMAKAASSAELRAAFDEHLDQTAGQIERLNQVFAQIGERARGKTCEAMQSIIEEGQQMMKSAGPGATRDALLIAAAQKVEHYEIASYGTARTFADQLGHEKAAQLLGQTLEEEKATDAKLTGIAESSANPRAAEERGGRAVRAGRRRGVLATAMAWSGLGGSRAQSGGRAKGAKAKPRARTRGRKSPRK